MSLVTLRVGLETSRESSHCLSLVLDLVSKYLFDGLNGYCLALRLGLNSQFFRYWLIGL